MASTSGTQTICKEMCFYCFDVIVAHLNGTETQLSRPSFSNDSYPLFVTWQIGKKIKLRGCIGTFSPIRLHKGLKDYAIQSAFRDSRFEPISANELPELFVSVSLLTNFENAANYLDWELGVHGIRIEFEDELGNELSATFLPEVAKEQGWGKTKTIDELIRKAGFEGHITEELRESIRLERYQSEKLRISYEEYQERLSSSQ